MPSPAGPGSRGPRLPLITIRCVMCDEPVETTREDTLTCGARCRKRRQRWMAGRDVLRIVGPGGSDMPPKRGPGGI